jgi:hypothetical protein
MKNLALCGVILLAGSVVGLAINSNVRQNRSPLSNSKSLGTGGQAIGPQISPTPNCKKYDPLNHNDEGYKEYLLSEHGYPTDISLTEAVNRFNQGSQCTEIGRSQPRLTEAEALASIRDALITQKKALDPIIIGQFERISKEQVMPKGSLIDVDTGYRSPHYDLSYWHIYIFVNLDKYPKHPHFDDKTAPNNSYLIRKQFISSEPIR